MFEVRKFSAFVVSLFLLISLAANRVENIFGHTTDEIVQSLTYAIFFSMMFCFCYITIYLSDLLNDKSYRNILVYTKYLVGFLAFSMFIVFSVLMYLHITTN